MQYRFVKSGYVENVVIKIGGAGIEPTLPRYQLGVQKPLNHPPQTAPERIELPHFGSKPNMQPLHHGAIIKIGPTGFEPA